MKLDKNPLSTPSCLSLGLNLWLKVNDMNSMQTCNSIAFYLVKKSFSDISRKCILPNMILEVKIYLYLPIQINCMQNIQFSFKLCINEKFVKPFCHLKSLYLAYGQHAWAGVEQLLHITAFPCGSFFDWWDQNGGHDIWVIEALQHMFSYSPVGEEGQPSKWSIERCFRKRYMTRPCYESQMWTAKFG